MIKNHKKNADGFNNFFKNVGPNHSKKFPPITDFEKFLIKQATSFSFKPISDNELTDTVSRLKPKSSFGPDGIPTNFCENSTAAGMGFNTYPN